MRKIILMMMLTTIAGCGEKASGSKTETVAPPAQNTNYGGQFGSGAQNPEEKFAEVKKKAESGSSKDQLGLENQRGQGRINLPTHPSTRTGLQRASPASSQPVTLTVRC